ncbi:uncharacterized protein AMSG_04736 [Thecamonas trahens ATCC 50062]|uniref:Uncharacterized protein n=1 Tax=Thecamonas trahens ATCC 50062 TaxID=461836 RepID=A0A0L0D9D9_THETB|nr:hypothetical protein AMSG_04736 [Thecamonas trahens ATCC 50062]KNC48992.1 hypothetical protein AMSG_04736 [Thecamonas trahens ATCC 50062]|eukprot:XP_013758405.1 hypothetical protein AMSG_04736 [Thecamonas trahens ATCC 50062]
MPTAPTSPTPAPPSPRSATPPSAAAEPSLENSFGLKAKVASLVATGMTFALIQLSTSASSLVKWLLSLLWNDVLLPPLTRLADTYIVAWFTSLSEAQIFTALGVITVLGSIGLAITYYLAEVVAAMLASLVALPLCAVALAWRLPLPYGWAQSLAGLHPLAATSSMLLLPSVLIAVPRLDRPVQLAVALWAALAVLPWPFMLQAVLPAEIVGAVMSHLSYPFPCVAAGGGRALCRFVSDPASPLHLNVIANAPLPLGDLLARMDAPQLAASRNVTLAVVHLGPLALAHWSRLVPLLIASAVLLLLSQRVQRHASTAVMSAMCLMIVVCGALMLSSLTGVTTGPPVALAQQLECSQAVAVLRETHRVPEAFWAIPNAGNYTGNALATSRESRWYGRSLAHGRGTVTLALPHVAPHLIVALRGEWETGRLVYGRVELNWTMSCNETETLRTQAIAAVLDEALDALGSLWTPERGRVFSFGADGPAASSRPPAFFTQALPASLPSLACEASSEWTSGRLNIMLTAAVANGRVSVSSGRGASPLSITLRSDGPGWRLGGLISAPMGDVVAWHLALPSGGGELEYEGGFGVDGPAGEGFVALHAFDEGGGHIPGFAFVLDPPRIASEFARTSARPNRYADRIPLADSPTSATGDGRAVLEVHHLQFVGLFAEALPLLRYDAYGAAGLEGWRAVVHRGWLRLGSPLWLAPLMESLPAGEFAGFSANTIVSAGGNVTCALAKDSALGCGGGVVVAADDGYVFRGRIKGSQTHGAGVLSHPRSEDAAYGYWNAGLRNGQFVLYDPVRGRWESVRYRSGVVLSSKSVKRSGSTASHEEQIVEAFVARVLADAGSA